MYRLIKKDDKGGKNSKVIDKSVVKNVTHEDYKNSPFKTKQMKLDLKRMKSPPPHLGTIKINKIY